MRNTCEIAGERALSGNQFGVQIDDRKPTLAVPMEKPDDLVANHLEERLLRPERLETILAANLDWRQEQSEHRREHIAELNKRAAESELRLKRLYDAIEAGVADIDDPALKDRIDGVKVIRDQAKVNATRAGDARQFGQQGGYAADDRAVR